MKFLLNVQNLLANQHALRSLIRPLLVIQSAVHLDVNADRELFGRENIVLGLCFVLEFAAA
ncbi:unnamed protein product [Meloidogyne enterolobii]|uniref:Uncharacterized protein n=1 Tax=Meloidogyne enterolobii TaxID=390850 RepID=A0ACB0ZF48_MELEN